MVRDFPLISGGTSAFSGVTQAAPERSPERKEKENILN